MEYQLSADLPDRCGTNYKSDYFVIKEHWICSFFSIMSNFSAADGICDHFGAAGKTAMVTHVFQRRHFSFELRKSEKNVAEDDTLKTSSLLILIEK